LLAEHKEDGDFAAAAGLLGSINQRCRAVELY
jgi:hypothetical protein